MESGLLEAKRSWNLGVSLFESRLLEDCFLNRFSFIRRTNGNANLDKRRLNSLTYGAHQRRNAELTAANDDGLRAQGIRLNSLTYGAHQRRNAELTAANDDGLRARGIRLNSLTYGAHQRRNAELTAANDDGLRGRGVRLKALTYGAHQRRNAELTAANDDGLRNRQVLKKNTNRLWAALCQVLACCVLVACGFAERTNPGDLDGGRTVDAGDVFGCEGTCTPEQLSLEVYAASGNALELFVVVQPSAGPRAGSLQRVDLSDGSTSELLALPTTSPERSGLLLDEGLLYWSDSQDQNADVAIIDPASPALNIIATKQVRPTAAVANSTSVYWGVRGGLMRYDKNTQLATRVHDFEPNERVDWIDVSESELLYTSNTFAYRLQLTNGIPLGDRLEIVQTTRPIALHDSRFYYLIPSTLSTSGNDELMSMPSAGGGPTLEVEEDDIIEPTVLENGDLLWFGFVSSNAALIRKDSAGNRSTRLISTSLGGLQWILAEEDPMAWISGTVLTLLGSEDCTCDS